MLGLRAWWFAAVALVIGVSAGLGPAMGGPLTGVAAGYQPAPYSQMHTFWIGENGALRTMRKEHNGRWHQAFDLTPAG